MRGIALVAVVAAAAGCGGHGQGWPDCLRILGATHVQVASPAVLAKTPKVFAAERAAAIDFSDGAGATIVVSQTAAAAAKTAVALGSIPPIINLPIPATPSQRNAVLRHGRVVMQWFGRLEAERQRMLFACATR